MIEWCKRKIANKIDKDIDNAAAQPIAYLSDPAPVVENKDAFYTIGVNQEGNTQLVIKINYGTATLTMDPGSVRRLIRQLEVTLEKEEQR
jgi:hypothetical protein